MGWPLASEPQRTEYAGLSTATSTGVTVTGHASAHTKGAWTELIASTAFASSQIRPIILNQTSGKIDDALLDLAVGGSGSEQVIVENLALGPRGTVEEYWWPPLPIGIPAGSRIAARLQTRVGESRTWTVAVALEAGGFDANPPAGRVVTMGVTAASTTGVQVDPGGTVNTKGAWAQITASTPSDFRELILGTLNENNAGRTACSWLVDIAVGGSGSEQALVENIPLSCQNSSARISPTAVPVPVPVPAGSRLAVRAQCSIDDATDRTFGAVLYGVT